MTPSPQCAECGGLGMVVVEDAIGHFLKACPMPACRGATSVKLKRILRLARSSAALLEAGERVLADRDHVYQNCEGEARSVGQSTVSDALLDNLQTAIARAKEGEL